MLVLHHTWTRRTTDPSLLFFPTSKKAHPYLLSGNDLLQQQAHHLGPNLKILRAYTSLAPWHARQVILICTLNLDNRIWNVPGLFRAPCSPTLDPHQRGFDPVHHQPAFKSPDPCHPPPVDSVLLFPVHMAAQPLR